MRVSIAVAIVLSAVGIAATSSAQAAIRRQTNITAQELESALQGFAKERDLQIIFRSTLVKDLRTSGVVGDLTAEETLDRLLGGTGLGYRYLDEKTVTIVPLSAGSASAPASRGGSAGESSGKQTSSPSQGKGFWSRLRLAQAETASASDAARRDGIEETSGSSSGESQRRIELEEIVVTGTNIRGVYPASSPIETYTAKDIARTGATTTEQFIGKLPQNLNTRTQYASIATSSPNPHANNGVDLRGLGLGSTLVLLNGRRLALASNGRAADVSLIPMSAIARVEVLTDGASAIYGSDAIGGVVNFVLREDFDGAETRASYRSVSRGGMHQVGATQTFGRRWGSGHGLVSYDYLSASPLDASERPYAAATSPTTLSPKDRRQSALATFSQGLGERVTLDGDFAFARRDVRNERFFSPTENTFTSETRQYFANVGAEVEFGGSLHGSLLGSYSDIDVDSRGLTRFITSGELFPAQHDTRYTALDFTAMLDGELFSLSSGAVRFSLGGGRLDEQYRGAQINTVPSTSDLGRATTYVFGELFVPLIDAQRNVPLAHRLELSLAARYTDYADTSNPRLGREFGSGASPKIGLLWAPVSALRLRGTYGESFRAPSLTQVDPTADATFVANRTVLNTPSVVLQLGGAAPVVDPETAKSLTLGFDYSPEALPGFHLSATYFDIDYIDRIAVADSTGGVAARANPAAFPDAIFRAASAAQIEGFLTSLPNLFNNSGISLADPQQAAQALFAHPNFWINDQRLRNLSLSRLDGIDLNLGYRMAIAWGQLSFGAQFTRILDYKEQASAAAPINTVVDTVLRPLDLRGRMYAGLTRGALESAVNVNYVDKYSNPFAVGGVAEVPSWITVDWSLSYDFGRAGRGIFDGVKLSMSAQNLFDRDPPFVAVSTGPGLTHSVGFDPTNANPLGRFVAIEVSKSW